MVNPTLEFMKIIDEFFDEPLYSRKCPPHDVIENDNEFIIEMELAGVKKDDITIDTEKGVLTIETERKKDDTKNYRRNEMYSGKYKRLFNLPDDVNADKIEATLVEGILTITIPKTINKPKKKKQIEIK